MRAEDIVCTIILSALLGALLLCAVILLIVEMLMLDFQTKKHKDYFALVEEHNNLTSKHVEYHNKNVAPLCRQIDRFESEKKYYSADKLKSEQEKFEKIKLEIERHEEHLSVIQKQIDEVHLKLKGIVNKDPKFKKYLLKHYMWRERQ